MAWSGWLCLLIGFIFGGCFGGVLGLGLADNYWRKKLIRENRYDKSNYVVNEVEKEIKNDTGYDGNAWW